MHTAWSLYCIFWHRNPGIAWPVHIIALLVFVAFVQTAVSERHRLFYLRTRAGRGNYHSEDNDNGTT